jgi:integrase/recombinase XerD
MFKKITSLLRAEKQMSYSDSSENICLSESQVKQAKTLNQQELRRVLDYVSTRPHAQRNRAMILMTYLAGMRVGEVANIRFCDVVNVDGSIRNEIILSAHQTKGGESRIVFVNERLKSELAHYKQSQKWHHPNDKFFYTQKEPARGFTPNTLAQHFHYIYKGAGLTGASSHSGRRTFITNLASRGVGVRVLASLAGHKNISVTQRYIDVNDDMKRRAIELA